MPDEIKPEDTATDLETLKTQLTAALADAEKWKNLSRQNEDRAKANADKAKAFDDLEEQSKTDLQKAIDRAEKAEKANAEREAKEASEKLRADIAKEKGVPASALRGATKEELEAHADELKALLPPTPEVPSAEGQGDQGKPIGEGEMSPKEILAAALGK